MEERPESMESAGKTEKCVQKVANTVYPRQQMEQTLNAKVGARKPVALKMIFLLLKYDLSAM